MFRAMNRKERELILKFSPSIFSFSKIPLVWFQTPYLNMMYMKPNANVFQVTHSMLVFDFVYSAFSLAFSWPWSVRYCTFQISVKVHIKNSFPSLISGLISRTTDLSLTQLTFLAFLNMTEP